MDITHYFNADTINELALAEALRDVLPGGYLLLADNVPALHVEITRPDGSELSPEDLALVEQIAAAHDPAQPSEEELAAEAAQQAREDALDAVRNAAASDPAYAALAVALGLTLD